MDGHQIDCDRCRTAISARLDDEDPGMPLAAVHGHLARCARCRSFEAEVCALHRAMRVTPAPSVPDLTPRILSAIGDDAPRAGMHRDAWRWWR